ncbi:hypothetical protein C4585_01335 [Candidatus Parcubacteria bacterium]|nr:MAG: hypothetical protein C4585_01335 [Candidatus Parcubacteria bacterium]
MTRTSVTVLATSVLLAGGALGAAAFVLPPSVSFERVREVVAVSSPTTTPAGPVVKHISTPEPMYAIYMTQCAVGTPSLRTTLVELIETTKLNAVVIDIKDYSGTIAFKPHSEQLKPAWEAAKCGASDMKEFIESLHEKGIYVIGRITVFQDPFIAKTHPERSVQSKSRPGEPWKDHKGLSFVAVNNEAHWHYILELSRESYELGFDELNYDYVRWPSDGPMDDIVYPSNDRAGELEKFFAFLHDQVKSFDTSRHGGHVLVMSADLFGYTTVLTDDLGIGQVLERALPYFDYIAPMVYPSHYNKGYQGLANPNNDPYKVVYTSMVEAVRRAQATTTPVAGLAHTRIGTSTPAVYEKPVHSPLKLRPWLQDFDYGKDYLPQDILDQTRATYDAGLTSWFFWDPANRYQNVRAVLESE